jgi:hypothetical protein
VNLLQHSLVWAIRVYRGIGSPAQLYLFGGTAGCRFTPTCSAYALEAIATHGALAGSRLAAQRLARCHPWGGCGCDPVPAPPLPPPRFNLAAVTETTR